MHSFCPGAAYGHLDFVLFAQKHFRFNIYSTYSMRALSHENIYVEWSCCNWESYRNKMKKKKLMGGPVSEKWESLGLYITVF